MSDQYIFLSVFILSVGLGLVARAIKFCTLAAIEAAFIGNNRDYFRMWLLAVAVAILSTHFLIYFYDLDLTNTHYLAERIAVGGAIIGGLMFGIGMAFVGTCSFGSLLRMASGDMRGVFTSVLIGISGYAAIRGIGATSRLYVDDLTDIALEEGQTASLMDNIFMNADTGTNMIIPISIALIIAIWCFASKTFRKSPKIYLGGLVIGALIAAYWGVSGVMGYDEFDPQPPQSYTFVSPLGGVISYMMLSTGLAAKISLFSVLGVIVGGFIAAWRRQELRLDAFDDAIEMRRHIFGSILMGCGGALAGGCTFGQGLTGLSTLSINSFLAFTSMVVGAIIGLKFIIGYYYKC